MRRVFFQSLPVSPSSFSSSSISLAIHSGIHFHFTQKLTFIVFLAERFSLFSPSPSSSSFRYTTFQNGQNKFQRLKRKRCKRRWMDCAGERAKRMYCRKLNWVDAWGICVRFHALRNYSTKSHLPFANRISVSALYCSVRHNRLHDSNNRERFIHLCQPISSMTPPLSIRQNKIQIKN